MRLLTSNNRLLQSSNRIMVNFSEIIKDESLVYWYDPSRVESYPGFDTMLYDLSGNNYNAYIFASPTFTGNSFKFDSFSGISSEIYFPIAGSTYGGTYDLTITLWFKSSVTSRYQYPLDLRGDIGNFDLDINDTDDGNNRRTMWVFWNSGGSPCSALPIGALGGHGPESDLLTKTWQCYTFRRDVNTDPFTEHFVNGVKIESVYRVGEQQEEMIYGGQLTIGSQQAFKGEIGSSHAYSRALTDAEIQFNYNVEKNRRTGKNYCSIKQIQKCG